MPEMRDFQDRIKRLVAVFQEALEATEWTTRIYTKKFRDADLRITELPALYLQKGPIMLLLDPIGYDIPGAEGLADIYLMPAYDPQASVYFEEGQWKIHQPIRHLSGGSEPVPEDRVFPADNKSINNVLESIFENAIP